MSRFSDRNVMKPAPSADTRRFIYDQPAGRVIFGVGAVDCVPDEVAWLDARRPLVISTPGRRTNAENAARRLDEAYVGSWGAP